MALENISLSGGTQPREENLVETSKSDDCDDFILGEDSCRTDVALESLRFKPYLDDFPKQTR